MSSRDSAPDKNINFLRFLALGLLRSPLETLPQLTAEAQTEHLIIILDFTESHAFRGLSTSTDHKLDLVALLNS